MPDNTTEPQSKPTLFPKDLQYLLRIYLGQKIVRPVDIDTNQLAYRWVGGQSGRLVPISANLSIKLADLQGIDTQKAKIIQNTKQFLAGFPANHVLMTGTRGSGKSSLVRALLSEYHQYGLRIIEVARDDLLVLDKIREAINDLIDGHGCRYIIYCDDLAFDKQDENYRTLKSILDGSLDSEQEQLLVYATSNRRHLLPQMMKDNVSIYDGQTDEVNPYETIDETVSLSDRFGLWLSFQPMDQKTYLDIAKHYVEAYGVEWHADVQDDALRWASERGGRSGRVAYQFSRQYVGTIKLSEKDELDLQQQQAQATQKRSKRFKLPNISGEQLDKLLNKPTKKTEKESEGEFSNLQILVILSIIAMIGAFAIMNLGGF